MVRYSKAEYKDALHSIAKGLGIQVLSIEGHVRDPLILRMEIERQTTACKTLPISGKKVWEEIETHAKAVPAVQEAKREIQDLKFENEDLKHELRILKTLLYLEHEKPLRYKSSRATVQQALDAVEALDMAAEEFYDAANDEVVLTVLPGVEYGSPFGSIVDVYERIGNEGEDQS